MSLPANFRQHRSNPRYHLNLQGSQLAARARQRGGLDPVDPISVYDLCDKLGVTVRFSDVNMEGMYDREPVPRIHISTLRPFGRRAFNCAHELGHHEAGHGTSIDQLQEANLRFGDFSPNEILANSFASNLLMPSPGLRKAFRVRGIDPNTATPIQLYAVSCNFGVGYGTLIEHLYSSLGLLSLPAKERASKATPKSIRAQVLGAGTSANLRIVDHAWVGTPVDAEVGDLLLCPASAHIFSDVATIVDETEFYRLMRCEQPGIGTLYSTDSAWTHFLRVQKTKYIGLARYRHLEESD